MVGLRVRQSQPGRMAGRVGDASRAARGGREGLAGELSPPGRVDLGDAPEALVASYRGELMLPRQGGNPQIVLGNGRPAPSEHPRPAATRPTRGHHPATRGAAGRLRELVCPRPRPRHEPAELRSALRPSLNDLELERILEAPVIAPYIGQVVHHAERGGRAVGSTLDGRRFVRPVGLASRSGLRQTGLIRLWISRSDSRLRGTA